MVCVMDKKAGVGNLSCKVCGQTFQAPINGKWQDSTEVGTNVRVVVEANKPCLIP